MLYNIESVISAERLKSYEILCPDGSSTQILGAYHWNLLLSQALYPFIQSAEVALRNAIHHAAKNKFSSENWFDFVIQDKTSQDIMHSVKKELYKKKQCGVDDVIAALNFGFWVHLLKQKTYRDQFNPHRLWPDLIPFVFPRYKRSGGDDRKNIYERFEEIKLIRNRLFHHEPIWKFKNALSPSESVSETWHKFNDIYKAIGWMSKIKQESLKEYGFVSFFKDNCTTEMLEKYKNNML